MILWLILGLVVVVAPMLAIGALLGLRRDVRQLRERVALLELKHERGGVPLSAVPSAEAPKAEPPPDPIPISRAVPPVAPLEPPPVPTPAVKPVSHPKTAERDDSARIEQLIGGVWLQNIGSVLLLLGVFFLILWSYTTGRLGPGWLVAAGAALGLGFIWRGDRTARSVPAFGHALIGVGFGIVYLSLYLGHFTLRVLDMRVAFAGLCATSLMASIAGLRYRAQTVAVLGVIGAFLPQLLAAWMPLRGFSLSPGGLLGYLAFVDLAVFALAARAGWGALNLTAMLLTTITWVATFDDQAHGWGIQGGLSALFTLLGLAMLPRWAAVTEPVRPAELAVVAISPFCVLVVSATFLREIGPIQGAVLMFAHAVVYLTAALWVEPRRADEDLWRPLTGAAILFFTIGVAAVARHDNLAVAWCTEGAVLVWLGLRAKGWWLRFCGYVVSALGAVMLLFAIEHDWSIARLPVFYPNGVRNLIALIVLVSAATMLARARPGLPAGEQLLSRAWTLVVNLLCMVWATGEARHLAHAFEGSDGRWAGPPRARDQILRVRMLASALTSAAWTVQAGVLLAIGWKLGSAYARWLALGLLGVTVLKFTLFDLAQVDVFWRFLTAIVVGAALLGVSYLYQRRARALRP
ncbi:MAG TPA: DUF2339 domain-containing protein [Candidatus Limnocylindria bacterium]|nr:DUF2339 domain-containing protein [Candidatus Limnocylindria bacterium]